MKPEPNYFGKDGYCWWVGVVESRQDPLMLGRLKVRILGCHTDDKTLIPTCQLHWSYIYQPVNGNLAMNGLGFSPTGPVEGTWVFGFFKDGANSQDPVVTGVLAGIPQQPPNPSLGFFDPSLPFHNYNTAPRKVRDRYYPNTGVGDQNADESTASLYPRQTHPYGCVIGESDTNRLARGQKIDQTIVGVRNRQLDVHIPVALVHPTPIRQWNEPQSQASVTTPPLYPYNHVYESESGHVVEFDDTPGQERIHIYHRSGTYMEISGGTGTNRDGDFAMKVVGHRYEVTMEAAVSHFQNAMSVTVDGECNVYCRSNANVQVDGNLIVDVGGNMTTRVQGNWDLEVKGNATANVGGTWENSAGSNFTIAAGGVITESASGTFSMTSGSQIAEDAPDIWLNSGHSSSVSPVTPNVPPFPSPLDQWVESRNQSGPEPVKETNPDPTPQNYSQQDC